MKNELTIKAFNEGYKAYGKYSSVPVLNKEFMNTVPNCLIEDTEGCKLRADMYKNYIKGWTLASLES